MNTELVLNYVAPLVEVIEVEVEKGFAQSAPDFNDGGSY